MPPGLAAGLALTALAGMMSGMFMVPVKAATRWPWPCLWGAYSVLALVVMPWLMALVLVRHLFAVYAHATALEIAGPFFFGALWGAAQVLFGITIRKLGFALGYGIIVGLGALLGTVVPMLVQHTVPAQSSRQILLGLGLLFMILGIAILGVAGSKRDAGIRGAAGSIIPAKRYLPAFLLAILCGLFAPMVNFAFTAGAGLAHGAFMQGNPAVIAAYAVWPIALLGGFFPNAAYSWFLIARDRQWSDLRAGSRDVVYALAMAFLWMGAFAIYGMSSVLLGHLGTSVGWGLMQICMILTATGAGIAAKEWHSAGRGPRVWLQGGLFSLISAILLLAGAIR